VVAGQAEDDPDGLDLGGVAEDQPLPLAPAALAVLLVGDRGVD
jgi:hypothetical protein